MSDDMVLCLHQGTDGRIYIGTDKGGVDVIEKGHIHNINRAQGLDGPSVWTITEDKNGFIYFGTYDGGINIWDGRSIIDTVNVADGMPTNAVTSSYCCTDESLYFGTDGEGVIRLKENVIDTLLLKGNTVWSIYEDKAGNMYFGTNDRGLIYFRDNKWDTLSINDGLSHNSILGILEDEQGKLYLTADNGLNIITFTEDGVQIRILGQHDGLAANECNQGAYFKDSQGYLWFGTINGVSRFDPKLYKANTRAPMLHLTRFRLFDKDIPLNNSDGRQIFKHNENYFSFDFIGIDLNAPYKVKYKYRLSGVDPQWITTDHPHIRYANLEANDYTFEVMAGNEWGYWSQPVSLAFTITPPFWKTWWFVLFALLVTVSPLIVLVRQRFNKILALERLRTRIAADLHDDIGAGLSEISILSAVACAKTPPDLKPVVENELNKIGKTARALIENMSDIVWLVNPKRDALSDLISHTKDSFADIFEAKGIQFRVENAEALDKIRLGMEQRQHLFLILKEALHNAVKYSNATEISLAVRFKGKTLSLRISDNGKGFDAKQGEGGNGLHNMRERAQKLGGKLYIESANGYGTTVEFVGKL